jgi:hypothetical protein
LQLNYQSSPSDRRATVNFTYDIFRKLPDGPVWVEAVQTIELAKVRLASLMKARPGDYFVYDISRSQVVSAGLADGA